VECTINGIGERAGNAALEEIVMALQVRKEFFKVSTGINPRELYPSSQLLTQVTSMPVQANKAIVGENAFAHEAGIHQDGMLKNKATYEIMTPDSVGVPASLIVLGKHSGRHALAARCRVLGLKLTPEEIEAAYGLMTALADKKKKIDDNDLREIVETCRQRSTLAAAKSS
jgi:2-isopropylmalate synthase